MNRCIVGDCRDVLRELIAQGVKAQMCVTSPPYFGLRDYGVCGQMGLESTPAEYVANMVEVFRLVRDVLADDGVLWLNLGDSYATGTKADRQASTGLLAHHTAQDIRRIGTPDGLKTKDLVGIPWRVAFALQADGWYLRQDIIWSKPNAMPESVRDRCTKAHEYIFLLSKRERYYYDADAIAEPFAESTLPRAGRAQDSLARIEGVPGQAPHGLHQPRSYRGSSFTNGKTGAIKPTVGHGERVEADARNKRSVWTVSTQPYSEAHFATFPPALIEPCILAGSRPGDVVLDPFFGSGTVGQVAQDLGRQWIGIELNPAYVKLSEKRTAQQGMVLV